jgi:V-type H+-transporting ATPase subunit C
LNTYANIGSEIASFGGPDWSRNTALGQNDGKFGPALDRASVKGSPVVPGSAKKVLEEGDSALYAVTILRGHYQAGVLVDETFTPGS